MIRGLTTISLAFAVAGTSLAVHAADTHTPEIACRVLLAPQPIPTDPGYRISIEEITIPPGHDGHEHDHAFTEYLHVVSGNGTLSVADKPDTPLAPDTIVVIPIKVPHQAHNASDTAPLIFTATFIENVKQHVVTEYIGEPNKPHGCPHLQK